MTAPRLLTLLLAVATPLPFIAPSVCMAQASASDEEARHLFEAGQTAFEAGEFERALTYFEDAYRLSRRPQLLYNIGVAADRVRNDARALAAFRQYLRELPQSPNRREVEARVRFLENSVGGTSAPATTATTTPATMTPATTAPATTTTASTTTATTVPSAEQTADAAATTPEPEPTRARAPVGLIIGAAAAGAVGVGGLAYWLERNSVVHDCQDAVANGFDCSNLSTIKTERTVGIVLTSVGFAAAAGLAVGAVVLRPGDEERGTEVTVSGVPSGLMMGCRGRF